MSQHTPGPWTHEKKLIPGEFGYERTIRSADGTPIANINIGPLADEANARLIAAAPEMLEALERLLANDRLMNAMTRDEAQGVLHSIAKARGEL